MIMIIIIIPYILSVGFLFLESTRQKEGKKEGRKEGS